MSTRKTMIYVGGLVDEVTEDILFAAFIPFGPLRSVQIPKDFKIDKSRGFGFVEFESEEDCEAAIENMEGAELFGKVLRCNLAKPSAKASNGQGKAVWSADEWIKQQLVDDPEANNADEEEE